MGVEFSNRVFMDWIPYSLSVFCKSLGVFFASFSSLKFSGACSQVLYPVAVFSTQSERAFFRVVWTSEGVLSFGV